MYAVAEESELAPREVLAMYMRDWKSGYDEAKTETEKPVAKKKAKKKSKKKAK